MGVRERSTPNRRGATATRVPASQSGASETSTGRYCSLEHSNHANAHAELFRTFSPQLYRKAYSVLRNKEDAEDALQNSWVSVLANLHSFEGRSSLSTWMTRIVINSSLMILRKKRKEKECSWNALGTGEQVDKLPQLQSESANPEQTLLESERGRILGKAISRLRPRARAALELAHLKELSLEETARSLGISIPAAKGRLYHARASLRGSTAVRAIARR
jgi:RNA polymerase sigma-70 factor, ECF subfamily